jgi:prophage antirepressor-like protein
MDGKVIVYKSNQFGQIRTITIEDSPWFVGRDVATILGYSNPQKAIRDHVDDEDKTVNDSFTVNGTQGLLINESGLYSLILQSKLPRAKAFKRWVTSEVLPSIRKTGSYKQLERTLEQENANTRRAQLLISLADESDIAKYREVLKTEAANILAGRELLSAPTSTQQRKRHELGWYCKNVGKPRAWAAQMGKELKKVGILQIPNESGEFVETVVNGRQRQTFEWYEDYLLPIVFKMYTHAPESEV